MSPVIIIASHNIYQPKHAGYVSALVHESANFSTTVRTAVHVLSTIAHPYYTLLTCLGSSISDLVPVLFTFGFNRGLQSVNHSMWKIYATRLGDLEQTDPDDPEAPVRSSSRSRAWNRVGATRPVTAQEAVKLAMDKKISKK